MNIKNTLVQAFIVVAFTSCLSDPPFLDDEATQNPKSENAPPSEESGGPWTRINHNECEGTYILFNDRAIGFDQFRFFCNNEFLYMPVKADIDVEKGEHLEYADSLFYVSLPNYIKTNCCGQPDTTIATP